MLFVCVSIIVFATETPEWTTPWSIGDIEWTAGDAVRWWIRGDWRSIMPEPGFEFYVKVLNELKRKRKTRNNETHHNSRFISQRLICITRRTTDWMVLLLLLWQWYGQIIIVIIITITSVACQIKIYTRYISGSREGNRNYKTRCGSGRLLSTCCLLLLLLLLFQMLWTLFPRHDIRARVIWLHVL